MSRSRIATFFVFLISVFTFLGSLASITSQWGGAHATGATTYSGNIVQYLLSFEFWVSIFVFLFLLLLFFLAFLFYSREQDIYKASRELPLLAQGLTTASVALLQTPSTDLSINATADKASQSHPPSQHLVSALSVVERIFHSITGERCGVAVKLFDIVDDDISKTIIFNYARDPYSKNARARIDNDNKQTPFRASLNSAFVQIIDDAKNASEPNERNTEGCLFFINNNLKHD